MEKKKEQEFDILKKLQQFAKENDLDIILYEDNKRDVIKSFNENYDIALPLVIKVEFIMN